MKKFLSLVLALVMTMSLVTISAGAKDFTDGDTVTYNEAIDVMSALKVIDGYPDGSFKPTTQLNRGQAAKIICNMILGPTTASALKADAAPFKDVAADNTFAGYIAFCVKEGIIDGYTDGTFKPTAPLTGYAFMKYLLGALGYDKDIEGYNGNNWSINVAKRALNIGLDDGLTEDFDGTKIVTREQACLFAFNALTADVVEYGSKTTVNVGGAEVVVGAGEAKKIAYSDSKDYRESVRNDVKDDGYQQFCEAYFSNLKLNDVTGTTDAFGRPANTWYKKADKIGSYSVEPEKTYAKNVNGKTIYKDLDLSKNYSYAVVVDGDATSYGALSLTKSQTTKINGVTGSPVVGTGSNVEVYKDEHKIVVVNEYLLQVAGEYNTKTEELILQDPTAGDQYLPGTVNFTLSSDDFDNLDTYQDEDYVLVTMAKDGANYEIQSIAPAEKVTAAVTEYVDDDTVTAGGEERSYNVVASKNGVISTKQYELKTEYDLYLDTHGNVLFADGVEAEGSYAYIAEFYKDGTSSRADVKAYAYFLDGTEKAITLNKVDGTKATTLGVVPGLGGYASTLGTKTTGWYRFTEKTDGKYDLNTASGQTTVSAAHNVDVTKYKTNKTYIDVGTTTLNGNANTKFVVVKANNDVVTYTGIKTVADIMTGTSGVQIRAVRDNGTNYAKFVFVDVGTDGVVSGGNTSSDLVYIMKVDAVFGHDTDDDTYYRFNAIVNGEEKKIKGDAGMAVGMLYTDIEYTSKGYITGYTPVAADIDLDGNDELNVPAVDVDDFAYADSVAATAGGASVKKNTLNVEGYGFYLADGAKVYVNKNTKSDLDIYTAGQFVANYKDVVGKTLNLFAVYNADGETTALYVNYR